MVKLKDFTIDFDCTKGIPFSKFIRTIEFGLIFMKYRWLILKASLTKSFRRKDINAIFISQYIFNGKRQSAKSKVGRILQLNNWQEHVVAEDENNAVVYASIKKLSSIDVYNYCLSIRKGRRPAYISFYSNDYLLYVSTDVIDVISNDTTNVAKLKDDYKGLYDTYHEHQ